MDRLRFSTHVADRHRTKLASLVVLAFLLEVMAGVGMAYVAGFHEVRALLGDFQAIWLLALVGALVISFGGYHFVYRTLYSVDDGPDLSPRQMRAVVAAGFGGFLAHGGGVLDEYALKGAGADERDAKVRVAALAGLEHGILALGGCAAAIALLASSIDVPPHDFTIPWAVIPVPGFLVAFWASGRYRERLRGRPGWRGKLGVFLDSIFLIRTMFRHPLRHQAALGGMALFWAADIFAGWAGLAMFGSHMNVGQFVVGFGTGMVFTRRTGPLAGAGVLTVVLSVTVWYSGAVFAAAVAGMFAYRFLALLMPMPFSLGALNTLREIGEQERGPAEGRAEPPKGEPALRESA
jgi:hypothetical protein